MPLIICAPIICIDLLVGSFAHDIARVYDEDFHWTIAQIVAMDSTFLMHFYYLKYHEIQCEIFCSKNMKEQDPGTICRN